MQGGRDLREMCLDIETESGRRQGAYYVYVTRS